MTHTESLIHHYSAAPQRGGLRRRLHGLLGYPWLMWQHRGLVWNFFRRELLGRFRGSFLGIFWVLIQPLFLFALYYLVFGYLFGPKATATGPDLRFAFFLFAGIIAWSAFQEGTLRTCSVVVDNGNLVKKVAFPSELLPVHLVLVAMMVYLVGAAILLVIGLALGVVHPPIEILAWPLLLIVHFVFTLGFGLILATLHVFMRDTSHLYGIVSQAWMFLSPVFWPPVFLADRLSPGAAAIAEWNPAYPLIQAHRQVLGLGELRCSRWTRPCRRSPVSPRWCTRSGRTWAWRRRGPPCSWWSATRCSWRSGASSRTWCERIMSETPAIEVRELSKTYRIYGSPSTASASGCRGTSVPRHTPVHALQDIDFTVHARPVRRPGRRQRRRQVDAAQDPVRHDGADRRHVRAARHGGAACSSSAPASTRLHRPREHLPERAHDGLLAPRDRREVRRDPRLQRARRFHRPADPHLLVGHGHAARLLCRDRRSIPTC